jgi:hypothetical protein
MHIATLLTHWLAPHTIIGHSARQSALLKLVSALLGGSKLSVTQLGRHRAGGAYTKHHIKAADRLLSNHHLHAERDGIYRAIARTLLAGIKRPVVLVDWSDADLRRRWLMIKAAVAVQGRAVSVYEKIYPMRRYNSPKTHREFLCSLKAVLPDGCPPIVVTDAGFRGPWFKAVEAHGWDWVGRIRNKIKYYRDDTKCWQYTDSLYKHATSRVRYVGDVGLSPRHGYRFACISFERTSHVSGDRRSLDLKAVAFASTADCIARRGCLQRHSSTSKGAHEASDASMLNECRSRRRFGIRRAIAGDLA